MIEINEKIISAPVRIIILVLTFGLTSSEGWSKDDITNLECFAGKTHGFSISINHNTEIIQHIQHLGDSSFVGRGVFTGRFINYSWEEKFSNDLFPNMKNIYKIKINRQNLRLYKTADHCVSSCTRMEMSGYDPDEVPANLKGVSYLLPIQCEIVKPKNKF